MFKPTKKEMEKALEIRVSCLKNRITHLVNHTIIIKKRDERIANKKDGSKWRDYMSTSTIEEVISKLSNKLEIAQKELILIRLNKN